MSIPQPLPEQPPFADDDRHKRPWWEAIKTWLRETGGWVLAWNLIETVIYKCCGRSWRDAATDATNPKHLLVDVAIFGGFSALFDAPRAYSNAVKHNKMVDHLRQHPPKTHSEAVLADKATDDPDRVR